MTEPAEWIAVATALGAAFALGHRIVVLWRAREVETSLLCPRTGARVHCAILRDDSGGGCVDVVSCSAFPPGTRPTCDRSCTRLLNLGLPIETDERQDGSAPG